MNIDDFHLKAITPFDTDKILFKQSLLRVLTKVRTIVDDETGRETIKGFLRNLRIEWNGDEMYTVEKTEQTDHIFRSKLTTFPG